MFSLKVQSHGLYNSLDERLYAVVGYGDLSSKCELYKVAGLPVSIVQRLVLEPPKLYMHQNIQGKRDKCVLATI